AAGAGHTVVGLGLPLGRGDAAARLAAQREHGEQIFGNRDRLLGRLGARGEREERDRGVEKDWTHRLGPHVESLANSTGSSSRFQIRSRDRPSASASSGSSSSSSVISFSTSAS